MPIVLRGGKLEGKPWPGTVTAHDTTVSARIGMGEKITYVDTGEIDDATGRRIFAHRPPKPALVTDPVDEDAEDDADGE